MHIPLKKFPVYSFAVFLLLSVFAHGVIPPHVFANPDFVNKVGIPFVRINPGSFDMGSPESENGRKWYEWQHRVILTRSYYMSATEITQTQWIAVMGTNPSFFQECGGNCPVESVSYQDCLDFIQALNQLEKTNGYRLPTEAEWEYACRAGSPQAFTNGDITVLDCGLDPNLDKVGWYCGNSGLKEPVVHMLTPHPAGAKQPNAWGLYDMHGNVNEWVMDACKLRGIFRTGIFNDAYTKDKTTDPISISGPNRIFRGGSWSTNAKQCRSASRGSFKPTAKRSYIGFRIVKTN